MTTVTIDAHARRGLISGVGGSKLFAPHAHSIMQTLDELRMRPLIDGLSVYAAFTRGLPLATVVDSQVYMLDNTIPTQA